MLLKGLILSKIRLFTYFTWGEGITILLRPLGNNETMINIYGKVLLSPHHILRSVTLKKKKIDKDSFLKNVQTFFKKYETVKTEYIKNHNYKKKMAFWFLECSSIIIFLFILIQLFWLHMPSNSLIVIISFILFLFVQAPLIIWLTRDCYSRNDLANRDKNKWITYICLTGFIGCFFYYLIFTSGKR